MSSIKIVECPRDAMQGIKQWIPSEIKLDYLQSVLSVGYLEVFFGYKLLWFFCWFLFCRIN